MDQIEAIVREVLTRLKGGGNPPPACDTLIPAEMSARHVHLSQEDLRELFPIGEEFESVTVNGWVLEVLGRFPQPGDSFEYQGLHVTVEKVARRRVEQIRIRRIAPEEASHHD